MAREDWFGRDHIGVTAESSVPKKCAVCSVKFNDGDHVALLKRYVYREPRGNYSFPEDGEDYIPIHEECVSWLDPEGSGEGTD